MTTTPTPAEILTVLRARQARAGAEGRWADEAVLRVAADAIEQPDKHTAPRHVLDIPQQSKLELKAFGKLLKYWPE